MLMNEWRLRLVAAGEKIYIATIHLGTSVQLSERVRARRKPLSAYMMALSKASWGPLPRNRAATLPELVNQVIQIGWSNLLWRRVNCSLNFRGGVRQTLRGAPYPNTPPEEAKHTLSCWLTEE